MTRPLPTLEDKYALLSGRVFVTGTQALVRLPMLQHQRDAAHGLKTAGFISGYRGSPLGSYDQALWKARTFLEREEIRFQPGVNEEVAATAVWGTQQVGLWPGARHNGVFGIWYGKGPGVDRCGDVFKHANMAGTSPHGGVLALAGDDHAAKSSTVAHQSEFAFVSAMMPVLNPADLQEILDFGLAGLAMSRFSGLWVGFKAVAETVDSSGTVTIDLHRPALGAPDCELPPGGLHIRWAGHAPLAEEERLMRFKLPAALAFWRANRLDRTVIRPAAGGIGIVTCGKSYFDVRQALEDLGIDDRMAESLGIAIYKLAMTWPVEPEGLRTFAEGLDELLIVEEKRALVENQVKELLYNQPADRRPVVVGKTDPQGARLLPSNGEMTSTDIAIAIARRLLARAPNEGIAARLADIEALRHRTGGTVPAMIRLPHYCSGCPHNTSTKVPEGSMALAGIGCHYMATWMDRRTETTSQMGGEGAAWIGQAPFTERHHMFVNIGDGTFYHSGILAIRGAVAAGVNITYKILFNDAVAMTGGQPVEGGLTVARIAHELRAEGVAHIVVVSDAPVKYDRLTGLPRGTGVEHRDDFDRVQRELREVEGVTAIIFDQTCAAEKRRRRKRGQIPDPPRRVMINARVCEDCGDCSVQSNCLSIVPRETAFGRKRQIDQSSCNKDYACTAGFCPSFVTVVGGTLRASPMPGGVEDLLSAASSLPDPGPAVPGPSPADQAYGILITGIGGTGVVTVAALLGMAAHLDGKAVKVLDQLGLSQKGGAVISHVRIAETEDQIQAVRIPAGGANLLLGCDLVVAAGTEALSRIRRGRTRAAINTHQTITSEYTRTPDYRFKSESLIDAIAGAAGGDAVNLIDATRLATALLGDSLATNLFLLGFAFQRGLIPLSAQSILDAIALNGAAVAMNRNAFMLGRRAAHDRPGVEATAGLGSDEPAAPQMLDDLVAERARDLAAYQDAAYAARYRALVDRVGDREAGQARGKAGLAEAVARSYHKLLAYKDEYEVARLYTDGGFQSDLKRLFQDHEKVRFHLAPPLIAERDPDTGHLRKRTYGPWMVHAFRVLARLKFLRGSRFDIFGRTAERRLERRLITDYEAVMDEVMEGLTPGNHALALEIASLPDAIRGFGHVKERNIADTKARESDLMKRWRAFGRQPVGDAVAAE